MKTKFGTMNISQRKDDMYNNIWSACTCMYMYVIEYI